MDSFDLTFFAVLTSIFVTSWYGKWEKMIRAYR